MKETGLMFKAPLVRSILDGSKTQTRRVLKLRPGFDFEERDDGRLWPWAEHPDRADDIWMPCPLGDAGDRIYVRETFAEEYDFCDHPEMPGAGRERWHVGWHYRADGEPKRDELDGILGEWKPSIHMPKSVARIWLDITGVRLERLQDISEADCIAEGISELPHQAAERGCWWTGNVAGGAALHGRTPRNAFQLLWESTGGDWAANPWCWVINFKRTTVQGGQ